MTTLAHPLGAAARSHVHALAGALLQGAWRALRRAASRFAQRRRLAQMQATLAALDDAKLRDVGLRRAEAAAYWAQAEGLRPPFHASVAAPPRGAGYRPYPRPVAP